MDTNKVWLSGVVLTQPVLTKLPTSKTLFSAFTLRVLEQFRDRDGNPQTKPNDIRIESLGKSADKVQRTVKQGQRFAVEGYLRHDIIDGQGVVRVRSFIIYPDDSHDSLVFRRGLEQALKILNQSRDLPSAIERIKQLAEVPASE